MAEIPSELKYTAEHEWVRVSDDSRTVRIGITDYAQEALGDVVYVSLPDAGTAVTAGGAFGEVESTKSVSEVFAPLAGTISARNESLDDQPDLINSDPYGAGWLVDIDVADDADLDSLLDAGAYGTLAG